MKHRHKDRVAFNPGPQIVTVRFEIELPAAIHISVRAAQSFNALLPAEQPLPPWVNYKWMPNPYAKKYAYLRVSGPQEAIHSPDPELLF